MSAEFSVTIAAHDDAQAVLCSPNGELFRIPTHLLPPGLSPGNIVNFSIEVSRSEEHKRRNELNDVSNIHVLIR
jgi:hypothetical protein